TNTQVKKQTIPRSQKAPRSTLSRSFPQQKGVTILLSNSRAQYGQLRGKASEQGLVKSLKKQATKQKTTVKFSRRKVIDSDEDDE
ncbi:hypothetical protein K5549_021585, partial [Capra hircus]